MNKDEKIEALLNLLIDNEVFKAEKDGTLKGDNERFGALCFATRQFRKGLKIYNAEEKVLK